MRIIRPTLALLLVSTGCGSLGKGGADSAPAGRSMASSAGALTTDDFVWEHGMTPVPMMSLDDGFCYLTSVTGDFDGVGQSVALSIAGGMWTLIGDDGKPSANNQIEARARCTSWSDFSDTPKLHTVIQPWGLAASSTCIGNPCVVTPDVETGSLAGLGSLCYATSIGGWLGPGDVVKVARDASGSSLTVVQADPSLAPTEGGATCIDFDRGGNLTAWQESATFGPGEMTVSLMPISDGVCMLAGVEGAMRGKGESVAVERDASTGNWVLTLGSQQGSLTGRALCLPFSQGLGVPCKPIACADPPVSCGPVADGCGHLIDCGACKGTDVCSAGTCHACVPLTCYGAPHTECGAFSDGCGGTLDCGRCNGGQTCQSGSCVGGGGAGGKFCEECEATGGTCTVHGLKETCVHE